VKASKLERARALRRAGKRDEALGLCEELLAQNPRDPDALFLAGSIELEASRFERALVRLKLAVELRPDKPAYLTNLGIAHGSLGALVEAEVVLRRALAVDAGFVPALHQLGIVLADLRRFEESLRLFARAVSADPKSLALRYTEVKALIRAARPADAVARFDAAIALAAKPAELCADFAGELERAANLAQAEAIARRSTQLAPNVAAGFAALGRILARRGDDGLAIEAFERAIALEPRLAIALAEALGTAWQKLGCLEDALRCRKRALALEANLPESESALVFLAPFVEGTSADDVLAAALDWNARHAAPRHAARRPHPHDRSPTRRLRLGYVSPDFRGHVQRFFVLPLFRAHDRTAFEVVTYSSVKYPDEWTARIRATADSWHDVSRLSDGELAQKIRDDGIDVLVDLTMHMPGGRLRTFAERPAPVQLTWLAYPGTTGVDGIDYRITDPVLDPPGMPAPYSERSLRLSKSFWCFEPTSEEPLVTDLPALATRHVTFGCLNNFLKVTPGSLARFARVLAEIPDSRLLLLAPSGQGRERASAVLSAHGVNSARVEFIDRLGHAEYLATYGRIDIALDCLPYNGHTTSLDAFWMGVPVVTQVGETVVGRAGASMAKNLGLDELVAHDADEFVRLAVGLAQAPARLAELRRGLRERLQRSPLMDAVAFTRELEAAYRGAWREFCDETR
jgi:predicted O-linked N-acetylglucosamine transferase (SPINDLY family)